MNPKQVKIVAVGVVMMLALAGAAWFFGISPQMKKTSEHNAATAAAVQGTATLNSTLASLQTKSTGLDNASGEYQKLAKQFPEAFDGSAWVAMVMDAAFRSGVDVTTITPSIPTVSTPGVDPALAAPAPAPVPGAPVAPVAADPSAMIASSSVTLNVSGSPQQIRAFVRAVGALERPLLATSVNITTAEGKATAEIAGTTYLMRALPEPGSEEAQVDPNAAVPPVDPNAAVAPETTPVQ